MKSTDIAVNVAATQFERERSRKCRFKKGDRVLVRDFKEDEHNYTGVVMDFRKNWVGFECLVKPDGRPALWRGTASLFRCPKKGRFASKSR